MTTRNRWKFRICTTTKNLTVCSFLITHFCDQRMAHSGRNMSSA